jgi:hypothetical protein
MVASMDDRPPYTYVSLFAYRYDAWRHFKFTSKGHLHPRPEAKQFCTFIKNHFPKWKEFLKILQQHGILLLQYIPVVVWRFLRCFASGGDALISLQYLVRSVQ